MEVNKRFLTVLTPEGEFLRARKENPHYQIGQEIMFTPVTQEKKASFFPAFQGRILWPATAALLLIFLFILPVYQNNKVYAYLSIDINPSIELGVNKKYQVIELKSYNDDGEKVINQIQDWKREDADNVVSSIIDEIKKQGYMKDKQKMVVASVYAEEDAEKQDSWKKEVEEIQKVISAEKLELTIVEGTVSEREKAVDEGLTLGLYKEKKLKEHNAKAEAKQKQKQKESNTNAEANKKFVPATEKSKPVENPVQTEAKKQKEQPKAVEENKTKISPGQRKKEEKQQEDLKIPAEVKQENAPAIPANEETSNNQDQKVQEPKMKENNRNNNKPEENKNETEGNRNSGNNGNNRNNGNGNEKSNHEDSSSGPKDNQPALVKSGENVNKHEE
nr:anti-sigma factor domain-containing protein [Bacillus benzoevorans]